MCNLIPVEAGACLTLRTPGAKAWWRLAMLLLAGVCGCRFATAGVLTICTYNVENYTMTDRLTDAGYRRDYPKPEDEKRALRTVIRSVDADVLVMQEMGSRSHLDELQRDLRGEGLDYPHAAWMEADDPDRHLAALSRVPFASLTEHRDLTFKYFGAVQPVKRGLLELRIATSAGEVTLFNVHLKSRFADRADDPLSELRRVGEATAIRDRILKHCAETGGARFAILGDFNDDRGGRATQRFLRRGGTKIAVLLPAADSRGHTWTHFHRQTDTYTRVDHVLASPALRTWVRQGAVTIYDDPAVSRASDHRPLVITLEWPDENEKGGPDARL